MAARFDRNRAQASSRSEPPISVATSGSPARSEMGSRITIARSPVADARIDQRVQEVNNQIKENNEDSDHDHRSHNQGVVAVESRLDKVATDSGYAENSLNHYRTGNESRRRRTGIGYYR